MTESRLVGHARGVTTVLRRKKTFHIVPVEPGKVCCQQQRHDDKDNLPHGPQRRDDEPDEETTKKGDEPGISQKRLNLNPKGLIPFALIHDSRWEFQWISCISGCLQRGDECDWAAGGKDAGSDGQSHLSGKKGAEERLKRNRRFVTQSL